MKEHVLGTLMQKVAKTDKYDNEQLEVIKYGLESIYIFITKFVLITLIAFLMGIIEEYLIFLLIYNMIRIPSFGLHATKSWVCLITSSIMFLLLPYLASVLFITNNVKIIIGIIGILLIYKNAPADTKKRPIINKTRRLVYKLLSSVVAVVMVITSLIVTDSFISNSLLLALLLQCIMISPLTYKLFNLPYNNYLNYQKASTDN